MRYSRPILALLAASLLAGCQNMRTDKSQYAGTDVMMANADYQGALTQITAAKEKSYSYKDRVIYYLDTGMLYHWNGEYEKSNEQLELAEKAIDENFTKSLTRSASTLILNDNAQAYAGEDYEDIYLNAFKALNYLALGKPDSAFVEVRRIDLKLKELDKKYDTYAEKLSDADEAHEEFKPGKNYFQESALGRYLSMLLYRNEYKWDDVRIDLEKISKGWNVQPDIYTFDKPDFERETERISRPTARLNVMAFSGIAPDKQASTFYIYTEENLIVLAGTSEDYLGKQNLSGLSVIPWTGVQPGYNFKFQLPNMKKRASKVAKIEVVVENTKAQTLQPLESLENVAIETFGIRKPLIYLKTLTRAVVKGLATQVATESMTSNSSDALSIFTRLATSVAVNQTENADLRMSRFFPATASIAELHLEEGTYTFKINYYSYSGALLHTDERTDVSVVADKLNVLESSYLN